MGNNRPHLHPDKTAGKILLWLNNFSVRLLQETGGAAFITMGIVSTFSPYGIAATLSALFLMIAILTNILSNNATAVLFTPIAVSAASQLGTDPLPFVFTVIFAANMCFATPMAYQTNLLVMGPGRYAIADYLRVKGYSSNWTSVLKNILKV